MNPSKRHQQLMRLVRIRDRQRDLAAAAVAAAQHRQREAYDEHQLALGAMADLPVGEVVTTWELERIGEMVDHTGERLIAAGRDLQARRGELAQAGIALERARKLRDDARAVRIHELDRREQRAADDRGRSGGLA